MYTDVEQNVAKNLAELRKAKNLKQSELGASVGYSDKTISKWENGASVPDIAALASLADFFGVSVDDMLRENATDKIADNKEKATKEDKINAYATLCLSIVTVILIAVMVYVGLEITRGYRLWQAFVWAVPPSAFLVYRFSKNTRDKKWLNALSLSVMSWSIVTAVYLQLLKYNLWQLFFVMLPIQALIIITVFFKKKKEHEYSGKRFLFF